MIKSPTLSVLCALSMLGACTSVGKVPTRKLATTTLRQANGTPAGTAIVAAAGEEVSVTVAVIGLPQGTHGLHLHAVGRCDGTAFSGAGPHLNPHGAQHGTANPAGSHLGDLPNIAVNEFGAGTVTATLKAPRAEVETVLFDPDGTAIVVHADTDDYRTDPSGNSGTRIACGVLKRD